MCAPYVEARPEGAARTEKEISEKAQKISRYQIVSTYFLHGAFKVLFSAWRKVFSRLLVLIVRTLVLPLNTLKTCSHYMLCGYKKKVANLRALQVFSNKGLPFYGRFFVFKNRQIFFVAVRLVCFFPLFLETKRWPHSKTRKAVLSKQLFVPKRGKKKCSHFFMFVNHLNQRNLPSATLVIKEIETEFRSSFFPEVTGKR